MRYAQIDSNGLCFAVSDLSGEVVADNLIALAENEDRMGWVYADGEWVEPEPQPEPEPEPTQDEVNAEILLNQMEQKEQLDAVEAALAEILLGQTDLEG